MATQQERNRTSHPAADDASAIPGFPRKRVAKPKYGGPRKAGTVRRNRRKPSGRGKGKGKKFSFCRIPAWKIWLGAVLIAVAYVLFFYYFFVDPFSFRWKALYRDEGYPSGYDVHGIDISRYQGTIDWEMLRNASIQSSPVRFVFIKGTEGVSIVDENFNLNFYQAKKNDFIRGVYHFYTPDVDATRQAQYFMKQVHLEPGDLPPVLDVEKAGGLSREDLQREVKKWLSLVEARYHVKPIIYSGYKFKLKYLNDSLLNTYPFWIAHYYVEKLTYKGPWHFWQYTDSGKLKGIKGAVDFNLFHGDMDSLLRMTIPEEDLDF